MEGFRALKFIISICIIIGFTACKKAELPKPAIVQETISIPFENPQNITYVVDDALLYTKNLSTGEIIYYNHFSASRYTSTLDPYMSVSASFDTIIKNLTSWLLTPDNRFILNGKKIYQYQFFNQVIRVYGLENGSSRPIKLVWVTKEVLAAEVYNSYVTVNGSDFAFYTLIYLRAQNYTGEIPKQDILYGARYGGVISPALNVDNNLKGTKWVITKYISDLTTVNLNDTITFLSYNAYNVKGFAQRNYSLSNINGNGMKTLILYDCATLGGSYSGDVLANFIEDGEINNALFKNLYNNKTIKLWMKKVQ